METWMGEETTIESFPSRKKQTSEVPKAARVARAEQMRTRAH